MAGLYIHIPFCASRCIYCGFYSTTRPDLQNKYVDALCKELYLRKDYLHTTTDKDNDDIIRTIYIGGGTPSQLTLQNLERIIKHSFGTTKCMPEEITIEANPEDITDDYAVGLKSIGANRISMGVQTFDDDRLKFLNRRHNSNQVYRAIESISKARINNISIDLMFGFPQQNIEEWEKDINKAVALDVNHISAYGLMYEEGTRLYNMREQNRIKEIDEELSIKMYDKLINSLTINGYEHYEISNFARIGFRSRHNSSYWHDTPYMGIGAAAHSYNILSRQWNVSDINEYIKNIEMGVVPMTSEQIDEDTHFNDLITTALRTSDGINLSTLNERYREHIIKNSGKYLSDGTAVLKDNIFKLTLNGIHISDMIMSDLMIV